MLFVSWSLHLWTATFYVQCGIRCISALPIACWLCVCPAFVLLSLTQQSILQLNLQQCGTPGITALLCAVSSSCACPCRHACSTRLAAATHRMMSCKPWRIILGGCSCRTQGFRLHMTAQCRHCTQIILSQAMGLVYPQQVTLQPTLTPTPQVSCCCFERRGKSRAVCFPYSA